MTTRWWKSKDMKLRLWCFEAAMYRAWYVLEARGSTPEGHTVEEALRSLNWYRAQRRVKRLRLVVSRRQRHFQALTAPPEQPADTEAR